MLAEKDDWLFNRRFSRYPNVNPLSYNQRKHLGENPYDCGQATKRNRDKFETLIAQTKR